MSPCKECIVRAGCTKDCKEYRRYCDNSCHMATFLSIICSAVCVVIMFYCLGLFDGEIQFKRIIYTWIWFASIIFNLYFNYRNEERMGELSVVIFGPFITFVFIFLIIFSFVFKQGVRKRA
jgi:hypothetical protein